MKHAAIAAAQNADNLPRGKALPLWPGDAPGSPDMEGSDPAPQPSLTWHPATATDEPRPAIIVCPGGGYHHHSPRACETVAAWLNSLGIHAAVLRYRLNVWRYPAPQDDILRSIRLLRHQAADLGIDADRCGVMGFSAGGHVAASAAVLNEALPPRLDDAIDQESAAPNLALLCYPVISCTDHCHDGSWRHLLGEKRLVATTLGAVFGVVG